MSVFRVNLNGTHQPGVPNNQYRSIAWSGVAQNQGGLWTTHGFVPTCGSFLAQWQIWIRTGFGGSNAEIVVKLIRNATVDVNGWLLTGTDVVAAIGSPGAQSGMAVCGASVSDVANGTDTYNLFIYATAADPNVGCTIDGNPAHTWFSAMSFG